MIETIAAVNQAVNSFIWGIPAMVCIIGVGLLLSVRTGFLQIRKFPYAIRTTVGRMFRKRDASDGAMTPFQAVCTALAGTVGTGNIAGVAGAIAIGGPGAVFWMWCSALLGMCTKFAEVTLAVHFRERSDTGEWVGGPMYYIKNGLGRRWQFLAVLYALFGVLTVFGTGNATQVNTIVAAVDTALLEYGLVGGSFLPTLNLIVGILVAVLVALVLLGGIKRIGSVSEKLVPFMALFYIVLSVGVVVLNFSRLPYVLESIVAGAFNPAAFTGGTIGSLFVSMQKGVSRGIFSNEAGLGTGSIAHACADTKKPVKQGMFGIFEVFADTIVICTLTALVILCSGTPVSYGAAAGAELTISGFTTTYGGWASIFTAVALCCFAYATMIHAIPDHVYVQEGQKLELDKKIPVTLAMSTKPQSVMAQIGERTFQAMKQERAVETCSQLKQGEYTLTCYLFGILPMKEVQVSVVNGKSLYVSGQVVGIYGAAQGVLVLGSGPVETVDGSSRQPAEHIVFPGDYITAVNGKAVTKKEELMERINQYGEQPVVLTLWRGAEQIQVSVEPVEAAEHKGYRLGLWVKDDMAGIGTLTYFDQDGNFGALGHGIGNGQTKDLLRLSDGRLYKAQVLGIKKGVRGTPGELEGVVYYGKDNQIGEVSSNTQIGIYGTLTKNFREEKKNESLLCPVGYKQEIQTKDAVILSDASGELQSYRIVIDDLDYTPGDKNKGIRFHVEDENLLKLTGGIVQGLSGSPILQDGKLIGAVTHVLVNDPTKGYGIFVEEMTANKIGQKT